MNTTEYGIAEIPFGLGIILDKSRRYGILSNPQVYTRTNNNIMENNEILTHLALLGCKIHPKRKPSEYDPDDPDGAPLIIKHAGPLVLILGIKFEKCSREQYTVYENNIYKLTENLRNARNAKQACIDASRSIKHKGYDYTAALNVFYENILNNGYYS